MEKDNNVLGFGCTGKLNAGMVSEKVTVAHGAVIRGKELVMPWAACGKERVVPLNVVPPNVVPPNERFLQTRNAKNVHERHIEDEEPNGGGGDGSSYLKFEGSIHQPYADEGYSSSGDTAGGLKFDGDGYYSDDDSVNNGSGSGKYDQKDLSGSDGDGKNKSGAGSSSIGNLKGAPGYGYPYRYR